MDIPLHEMLQTLRQELQASMVSAVGQELKFRIEAVDLELQVAVSKTSGGKGGIKFWVINAAGEHKRDHKQTHTIKLKLQPVKDDGGQALLGGHYSVRPE